MTRIKLERGYANPDHNANIIVELADGTITGAKFNAGTHTKLYDPICFEPIGVMCSQCMFSSPVVAWYAGVIE